MRLKILLLPLLASFFVEQGFSARLEQKDKLVSVMQKIKAAAENHIQTMKTRYKEHNGPSARAIVDVHISDKRFLPLYTELFESKELLKNFVDQRTIDEMSQITRANAVQKLEKIYQDFFQKEKLLNFTAKDLLAPQSLQVRKIGEYHPYNFRDFFNELNQHDVTRKELETLEKNLRNNDEYDSKWKQILNEFKIDATKYEGPAPQTYISFVKLMYFFRGFLTHNLSLIAQNPKKFESIFDFTSFRETIEERKLQNNWLCGPGYANRLLLDLIVFLRLKISLAFAETLDIAEMKQILTEDEYQAMFSPSNTLSIDDILAKETACILQKEDFEACQRQLEKMTSIELKLLNEDTDERKSAVIEKWLSDKQPLNASFHPIYQKQLKESDGKDKKVNAFQAIIIDLEKTVKERKQLIEVQNTYKDVDTLVIKNMLKEFNQFLENEKEKIYFNPQNRSSLLQRIGEQVCVKHQIKPFSSWDDFVVFLKALETFFVSQSDKQNQSERKNQIQKNPQSKQDNLNVEPKKNPTQNSLELQKKEEDIVKLLREETQVLNEPLIDGPIQKISHDFQQKVWDEEKIWHYLENFQKIYSADAFKNFSAHQSIEFIRADEKTLGERSLEASILYDVITKDANKDQKEPTLTKIKRAIVKKRQQREDVNRWNVILGAFEVNKDVPLITSAQLLRHFAVEGTRAGIVWKTAQITKALTELKNKPTSFFIQMSEAEANKIYENIISFLFGI